MRSVTTLADLLERFGLTIAQAVDTESGAFLLLPEQGFILSAFRVNSGSRTRMELHRQDQAIIAHLERTQEPTDELHRIRSIPRIERVRPPDALVYVAVAMGIFSREQLAGVMLLVRGVPAGFMAPRRAKRAPWSYAVSSRSQLKTRNFTEVQNAKIYNETLLGAKPHHRSRGRRSRWIDHRLQS